MIDPRSMNLLTSTEVMQGSGERGGVCTLSTSLLTNCSAATTAILCVSSC